MNLKKKVKNNLFLIKSPKEFIKMGTEERHFLGNKTPKMVSRWNMELMARGTRRFFPYVVSSSCSMELPVLFYTECPIDFLLLHIILVVFVTKYFQELIFLLLAIRSGLSGGYRPTTCYSPLFFSLLGLGIEWFESASSVLERQARAPRDTRWITPRMPTTSTAPN
jgi:hypothetical protein